MANRRSGIGARLKVLLDNATLLFECSPPNDGAWHSYVTLGFTATSGSHQLSFVGPSTGSDRTSLLDTVTIEAAPDDVVGQFGNPSFESPSVPAGHWLGELLTGDVKWQGTNSWGIASGSTPWSGGGATGSQYAYVQSLGTGAGSIAQTVTGLVPGQVYSISFMMAARASTGGIPLKVLMDDTQAIFPYTSPGSDGVWRQCNTAMFLATKDTYLFRWQTGPTASDKSNVLDDVSLQLIPRPAPPEFFNGGFETPALASDTWVANPTGSNVHWDGVRWGVANGLTQWGNGAFAGSQYAYLQSTLAGGPASLEQTIDNLVIGRVYRLRFRIARRSGTGSPLYPNPITVTLGGMTLFTGTQAPKNGSWVVRTALFTATSEAMLLQFTGSACTPQRPELTSLIDEVSVTKASS